MKPTLLDAIRAIAAAQPYHLAVEDGKGAITYATLLERIDAIADELRALHGKTLALLAENSSDWIVFDLACLAAHITCVPLPGFFSDAQLRNTLHASGADLIVSDNPSRIAQIAPSAQSPKNLGRLSVWMVPNAATPSMPVGTDKITFTSGSSGAPKGVCLNAASQFAVASSLRDVTADIIAQRHFSVLPYATLLENIAGIYLPLLRGATIVALPAAQIGFNGARLEHPQQFLHALTEQQPNSLIVLPQFLPLFINACKNGWKPPASLRFIAVGGGKVPVAWLHQSRALGLPVYEGYGLSECASVVALNTPAHDCPGMVGRVLPHCRVTIEKSGVTIEKSGVTIEKNGDNENGEIVVHGNSYLGYLGFNQGDGEQTDCTAPVHTGDLGAIDADNFLAIAGRSKNLLISSYGRNISPEWPETELMASGLFRHCIVFGDARPYCVALLELIEQVDALPHATHAAITDAIAHANKELPEYAQIKHWHCLQRSLGSTDLLTANGRPRRDAIAAHYRDEIDSLYSRAGDDDEFLSLSA